MDLNQLKLLVTLIGISDPDARRAACESTLDALITVEYGSVAQAAEKITAESAVRHAREQRENSLPSLLARAKSFPEYEAVGV